MAKGGKKGGNTGAKKVAKKEAKKLTKRGQKIKGNKTRKTFVNAIRKVNKGNGLSGKGAKVMNSFVFDMMDRIASAAAGVARAAGKQTINAAAAQAAVRMVLPADLAKHSAAEAGKALTAFSKTVVKAPSKPRASKKTAKK